MYEDTKNNPKYDRHKYYSFKFNPSIADDPEYIFSPYSKYIVSSEVNDNKGKNQKFNLSYSIKFVPPKDVTFTKVRTLTGKDNVKYNYFIVYINTLYADKKYIGGSGKMGFIVLDHLSYDGNFKPTATVHKLHVSPFSYDGSGATFINSNTSPTFTGFEEDKLAWAIIYGGLDDHKMTIIPEGSILKNQVKDLKNQKQNDNIQLPADMSQQSAVITLSSFNDLFFDGKSKSINEAIHRLEKNKYGEAQANDYNEIMNGAISSYTKLSQVAPENMKIDMLSTKASQESTAAMGKQLRQSYLDIIVNGIFDVSNAKAKLLAADQKLTYLLNMDASSMVRYGGKVFTNFYMAAKAYDGLREISEFRARARNIFYKADELYLEVKNGITSIQSQFDGHYDWNYAKELESRTAIFGAIVNALSLYYTIWQIHKSGNENWLQIEFKITDKLLLSSVYHSCKSKIDRIDTELAKGNDVMNPPNMMVVLENLQEIIKYGSNQKLMKFLGRVREAIQDDKGYQNVAIQVLILVIGIIFAEVGGLFFAELAEGFLLGKTAVQAAELFGQALGFSTASYSIKSISGEKNVSFLEEFGEALLMMGVLKMTSLGIEAAYMKKYGQITTEIMEGYKLAQTVGGVLSLQAYAEVSTRILTGKWMDGDERIQSVLMNVLLVKAMGIAHKLLAEPIKTTFIDLKIKYGKIGNLQQVKISRLKLETLQRELVSHSKYMTEYQLPESFRLLQELQNAEMELLLEP